MELEIQTWDHEWKEFERFWNVYNIHVLDISYFSFMINSNIFKPEK